MAAGDFVSHGPNHADGERQAARYVDRILKGAKPAVLSMQPPAKHELIVDLKTAKHSASPFQEQWSPTPSRRAVCRACSQPLVEQNGFAVATRDVRLRGKANVADL